MKTDMGKNMSIDRKELLTVLLCITAVFLAIIGGTGCLISGYHLVDDHWVMRTVINLQSRSIMDIAWEYITQDMCIRLRQYIR